MHACPCMCIGGYVCVALAVTQCIGGAGSQTSQATYSLTYCFLLLIQLKSHALRVAF